MAEAAFREWLKRKAAEPHTPRASPSREQICLHLKEDARQRVYNNWLHSRRFTHSPHSPNGETTPSSENANKTFVQPWTRDIRPVAIELASLGGSLRFFQYTCPSSCRSICIVRSKQKVCLQSLSGVLVGEQPWMRGWWRERRAPCVNCPPLVILHDFWVFSAYDYS